MTARRVHDRGGRSRSLELFSHLAVAVLVPVVGGLLLGTFTLALVVRTSALGLAFTLVAAGLVRSAALGRAEWRRDRPEVGRYAGVVGRFLLAFLLVVVATS